MSFSTNLLRVVSNLISGLRIRAGAQRDLGHEHHSGLPQSLTPHAPNPPFAPSTDPVTGLAGRGLLEARILAGMVRAQRSGTGLVVLWVDMHGAEQAMQMLGHEVGDEVLRAVAKRLQAQLNIENILARVGPYAFAAVCEGIMERDEVAQRMIAMRQALAEPVELSEGEIHISSGLGSASFPADATDLPGLFAVAAQRAAFAAKRAAVQVKSPPTMSAGHPRAVGVPSP